MGDAPEGAYVNYGPIEILEWYEAVRRRPAMYVGSTDARGLAWMLWGVAQDALELARRGRDVRLDLTFHPDGSVSVCDDGPTLRAEDRWCVEGLTCGPGRADRRREPLRRPFAVGHLGANALAVASALSAWLEIGPIDGDPRGWRYEQGVEAGAARLPGSPARGLRCWFRPDPEIFADATWDLPAIRLRLSELTALCPALIATLTAPGGPAEPFQRPPDGLAALLPRRAEAGLPALALSGRQDDCSVDVAVRWHGPAGRSSSDGIRSWACLVATPAGGFHHTGFRAGLVRALTALLGQRPTRRGPLRCGLDVALRVDFDLDLLRLEGALKSKLGTREVAPVVEGLVAQQLPGAVEAAPLVRQALEFLAAIERDPRQLAPRAVYADWLAEQGATDAAAAWRATLPPTERSVG